VIDRAALHVKLDRVVAGEKVTEVSATPGDVPNDLSFLVDVRRRVKLAGNGPRALALTGHTAYAAMYFSDSVCAIGLDPAPRVVGRAIALGPEQPESQLRTGEKFFFDADLCFQHWQSCGSCHPDARVDGLNWDLLNDGIGNPKNTKSMLLSFETPPVMSLGVRESADKAVRSGIKFIQFAVRPEADALAIDEYLKSLKPVPSPALVNGGLSDAAKRGQAVFDKAGCTVCHPAPLFTDLKQYEMGMGKGRDEGQTFDTPTLVETWRTAPYLHDGRAATLRDVVTTCNPGDKHGTTSTLTPVEVDDLVAYLSSL
jgi:cytochrome c peroxidase